MEVLGDLVARDRRSDATALRVPAAGRSYDYRRFITSAWKVGNFLRHLGVRGGDGVAVADEPAPEPVLTLYGAACLGAVVRFDPASAEELRALVVPTADVDGGEFDPATKPVGYGDPPADPAVAYFERDVWSENPTAPPDVVRPEDPLLRTDRGTFSHARVLEAVAAVLDRHDVGPDTTVAIAAEASFARPGTVAAGLVAPILAGGTIAIGEGAAGDVVVGGPDGDVNPSAVLGET